MQVQATDVELLTPQQLNDLMDDIIARREDDMFVAFSAAPNQHDGSQLA